MSRDATFSQGSAVHKLISALCYGQITNHLQTQGRAPPILPFGLLLHSSLLSLSPIGIFFLFRVSIRLPLLHRHLFGHATWPNFVLGENDSALSLLRSDALQSLQTAQFSNFPEDHLVSLPRVKKKKGQVTL